MRTTTILRFVLIFAAAVCAACGGCKDDEKNNDALNNGVIGAACDPIIAGCDRDAICETCEDAFYCYCPDGFQGDGKTCVELGECDDDPSVCGENAFCAVRSAGSFCACEEGFQGDGFTCRNLDECERLGAGICGVGTCVDTDGGYDCDCPDGYGGKPCVDIDECVETPDICGAGVCANEEPGYTCTCEFGYAFDGTTCVDIDECQTGDFECPGDRTCKNEPGTYSCGCPDGYTGDGELCTVLADCQQDPGECDANASCKTTPDGDTCECRVGFAGDGATCREAGWAMLSAGATFTCGIREDRTLWCWGKDSSDVIGVTAPDFAAAPVRIGPSQRFKYVDAGKRHACAISSTGKLSCWGLNRDGRLGFDGQAAEPTQVGSASDWRSVSVSREDSLDGFTCGIRGAGTLWCWGANADGQLGLGSTQGHTQPQQVGSDTNWAKVDAGEDGACAIKTDRTMWCWGGSPTQIPGEWTDVAVSKARTCATTPDKSMFCWSQIPTDDRGMFNVSGGPVWASPSVGRDHLCAVDDAGTAYCMGDGSSGQIGRIFPPGLNAQWQPAVSGTYVQVVSGFEHTCAIADDRTAHCWGRNVEGELGFGTAGTTATPRQVGTATVWSAVSVGELHACGIAGNRVACWGNNFLGQTGDQSFEYYSPTPQANGLPTNFFTRVSVGKDHTCARNSTAATGQTLCFGGNAHGQIGSGNVGQDDRAYVQAMGVSDQWTSVVAGGEFTCGIVAGDAWCWGRNDIFQLGLGSNGFDYSSPTEVNGPANIQSISASLAGSHVCVINPDQNMYCWGDNREGQLGTGSLGSEPDPQYTATNAKWTQVDTGLAHTCAVSTTGTLWCWGNNDDGQHGIGSFGAGSRTPVQVGTKTTWQSVSAGAYHTCAIDGADGSLWCWGRGDLGQLGNGEWIDSPSPVMADAGPWSMVDAGTYVTCAVKADGALYCWGHGLDGLLADGSAWSLEPLPVGD